MPYAHITGWGMYVPEPILTNDDICKLVDTNDEWIRERTGIRERRIAARMSIPPPRWQWRRYQGTTGGKPCSHRIGFDHLHILFT